MNTDGKCSEIHVPWSRIISWSRVGVSQEVPTKTKPNIFMLWTKTDAGVKT